MNSPQSESVKQCYKVIDDILIEVGIKDPACLYLCTNYVDRRLGYLMAYFNEHQLIYTDDQKQRLAKCLKNFLNNLSEDDTYILPKSGTYNLDVPKSTLLQIIELMENMIINR